MCIRDSINIVVVTSIIIATTDVVINIEIAYNNILFIFSSLKAVSYTHLVKPTIPHIKTVFSFI